MKKGLLNYATIISITILIILNGTTSIYAYNILERRLAGILLAHLTTADTAGSEKRVPIKDVYYALIDNNIINISKLSRKKAKTNEKDVYQIYRKKQETVLSTLRKDLQSGTTIRKNLSEEKQDYVAIFTRCLRTMVFLLLLQLTRMIRYTLTGKMRRLRSVNF